MTNQELCQFDYKSVDNSAILFALCDELISRMEVIGTRIHELNKFVPMVHPDALKATC